MASRPGGGMGPMMDIIPLTPEMVPLLVGIMNSNYSKAISMYVRHFGKMESCAEANLQDIKNDVFVVAYKTEGSSETKTVELPFQKLPEEEPLTCHTIGDARRAFVNMARHCSQKLGEHIDLPPEEASSPKSDGADNGMASLTQMMAQMSAAGGPSAAASTGSAGQKQTGVRTLGDAGTGAAGGGKGGMAEMMAMMMAAKGKGKGKGGYEAPADPWAASGAGQRLDGGSSAPAAEESTEDLAGLVKAVDPDAPSLSIRVKLPDGKAVPCTFNPTHTVQEVRAYLQVTHPDSFKGAYSLMDAGAFPPKKLADLCQSLESAGIKSGSSLQCR
eukprot:TRINITY_DN10254_c0_g1_i1.p1 TRINITY_DN10254_c0_g1~~TRINITY_DN10254_c0_g1_i1.p1  ORF type:complete len:330 (-),score=68.16 TRINITY_DN10254_c0_g1_i1:549-1538(-)